MGKKVSNALVSAKTKVVASVAAIIGTVLPTFCASGGGNAPEGVENALENVKGFIITIARWGGSIIALIGLIMIGKAFYDSTSGQQQPGAVGKALGMIIMGLIMIVGASVIDWLTGTNA